MAKKILVVDDDAMNLKMAEFILKTEYSVATVDSGNACLDYLSKQLPDLILLDIEMPLLNGFDTLEKIRKTKDFKELPVIFLTASSDVSDVAKASLLGAIDFVKKPFMPDDLMSRVKKIIG